MTKRLLSSILSALLVVIIAVSLSGCATNNNSGSPGQTDASAAESLQVQDVGEGSTVFTFEVTDDSNAVSNFNVHTDETTVGEALLKAGLIEGDESEFGLYVKTVNGLKADFDTDKAYWAFYVDGAFAETGVDTTNIEAGKVYSFVYTKE